MNTPTADGLILLALLLCALSGCAMNPAEAQRIAQKCTDSGGDAVMHKTYVTCRSLEDVESE